MMRRKKKKINLLKSSFAVLLVTCCFKATAFVNPDSVAVQITLEKHVSYTRLTQSFKEHDFHDDSLNYRMIFKWITLNIKYDTSATEYNQKQIVKKRGAMCDGFSRLLIDLLGEFHIACTYYKGVGKEEILLPRQYSKTVDHAWISVTINGTVYFSDPTWATSKYNRDTKSYNYWFDESSYLVNPNIFIYDHFPITPNNQLIKEPISFRRFRHLPTYQSGFEKLYPHLSHIPKAVSRNGIISIVLDVMDTTIYGARSKDSKGNWMKIYPTITSVGSGKYKYRFRSKIKSVRDYNFEVFYEDKMALVFLIV